jgi:Fe-Mn family superoxide dismutase
MHTGLCAACCAALVVAAAAAAPPAAPPAAAPAAPVPRYAAVDYPHLKGIPGLPDALLSMHVALYNGYVKNANLLAEKVAALSASGGDRSPEYAELKRRFGWEYDGMRLHELYFENLGKGEPLDPKGPLARRIAADFGSVEAWRKEFVDTGMMRGIGWAALVDDPRSGKLVNVWIGEHDVGHLSGARVILVMDVFEHAYLTVFGLDRARYIDAFLGAADWKVATKRLDAR